MLSNSEAVNKIVVIYICSVSYVEIDVKQLVVCNVFDFISGYMEFDGLHIKS